MPIRKIKAGLVLTKDVDSFVGEPGYLFYDESPSGDKTLRISDGVTPGGVAFLTAASGGSSSADSTVTNLLYSSDSTAVQIQDNFIPTEDNVYSLGSADKRFSEIHVAQGSIYLGDLVIKDSGAGAMQILQSDGVTPAKLDGPLHNITLVGDDSTGTTFDLNNTVKFTGTGGITVSVTGDDVTIDGSGVAGSGSLTIADDSSTTATITNGQDTLKFAGGTNITTAISGDTLTITGPDLSAYIQSGDNISSLTNDAGYITSADVFELTVSDDSSTTQTFTKTDTFNIKGAQNITTAISGDTLTITGPDLTPYLTSYTETNDLTSAVTWANVPDANITQSSVTQHQSALSITESQISDLGSYLTDITLNVVADDSQTIAVNNGGSIQFSGGTNITTSTSSDGVITITGPDLSAYIQSGDNISSLTNDAGYITSADVFELTVSDDSSTTATLTKTDTFNIKGAQNITTAIVGDTITITGPDLSPYLTSYTETNDLTSAVTWANVPDANITESSVTQHQSALAITESQISDLQSYLTDTTLNIVADDSQTIAVNNGGSIQFSGGTNITTSTSSDGTITITAPSTVSSFTNDAGYLDTAQLTIVGDDSTGTSFDASTSPTVRFLGAGNVSVAVSGSNVIITGSGAGGSTTYTQDTAPTSPSDGETWLKTDSGALYIWLEEASGVGQWIETGSAGSTLDAESVTSFKFGVDDSGTTTISQGETLSILGGQGISTDITGTGEIRISSTGSSVTTDDAPPSSPNDGDLWYETDTGSLYVYVVEGESAHWIETGGGAGTSASVITQDDQPTSASDGNLWFDTDQGGLYVFVEENGVGNWIETGTSGQGPAIYTQDDSPSTPSNGDLWWDTDSGSLYIYIAQNGSAHWIETAGSGQTGGGGITSVAADATPELGGNLDANSYNITNVSTISVATNGDPGTDPATDSGVGYIYAKGTTAELFVKDGAGNITQISPHNQDAEWIYYSENVKTGKRVKVNMEKMIRRLEQITGETFFEIDEPNKLKP